MTKAETAIARVVADPDLVKRDFLARAKLDKPELTDEQLEWSWRQAANQIGL